MWENSHMFDLAVLIRNIDRRLGEKGISAKAASLEAGLSDSYISQLRTGKSGNPRLDQLAKLGDALGMTLSQMLDEAGVAEGDPDRRAVFLAFDSGDPLARAMMVRLAKSLLGTAGDQPTETPPRSVRRTARPPPRPPLGGSVGKNEIDRGCGKVVRLPRVPA
jgi:transcriptional regulator with XRE-family HTH domain